MKKNILFIMLFSLLFVACENAEICEKGEGDIVEMPLYLSSFNSVELEGTGNVYITQGAEQSVIVKGQANIISLLKTNIKNGTWEIDFKRCVRKHKDLEIYITIPEVKKMKINGSGDIKTIGTISGDGIELNINGSGNISASIDVNRVDTKINGSGNISVDGTAENHYAYINGSGNINSYDLITDKAEVKVNGSGDVKVNVEEELKVKIGGSGDVYYKGSPSVSVDISGSGSVKKY